MSSMDLMFEPTGFSHSTGFRLDDATELAHLSGSGYSFASNIGRAQRVCVHFSMDNMLEYAILSVPVGFASGVMSHMPNSMRCLDRVKTEGRC